MNPNKNIGEAKSRIIPEVTPIPKDVEINFAQKPRFGWGKSRKRYQSVWGQEKISPIALEVAEISEEFYAYLARHPRVLYEVSPRKFEEIIAGILKDRGCEVQLTPQTRDGGRDILAVFKTQVGEMLTIVECKRWNSRLPVGIDVVERLLWVAARKDKASSALIATTSYFSPDAIKQANEFKYQLKLKDFEGVKEWVQSYGKWRKDEGQLLWQPF